MKNFKLFLLPAIIMMCSITVFAQNYETKDFPGKYRLKSMFRGAGESLESNQGSNPNGAFMDKNQNVSGQIWKIENAGNGYYRLKSLFRGDGECLEGNQADSKVHGGAAFMSKRSNASGQLWRFEKADKGHYRLLTKFRGNGECLESNQRDSKVHGGSAFMSKRANASGQLWKIESIDGVGATKTYKVGDEAFGGIVYALDKTGEHGWVCAKEDLKEKLLFNDAEKAVKNLTLEGHNDWQIPTKSDLIWMYQRLHKKGKGNFHASDFHWSKKTDGVNNFFKRFQNGEQGMYTINGHYGGWIRPVRKF